MTTPQYLGAALCWDKSRPQLYKAACLAPDERANAPYPRPTEYDCTGILMQQFYLNLYHAGETNQCVCKFKNINNHWVFQSSWGPCHGACVGKYRCTGSKAVVDKEGDNEVSRHILASDESESASDTSDAGSLTISWKVMLGVAVIMVFNQFA